MKNAKSKLAYFMAFLLLGLVVISIVAWDLTFKEKLLYEDVPVLKESVIEGTLITESMIYIDKKESDDIVDGAILDVAMILGKTAKQYIPKNAQLVEYYLTSQELVLADNEFLFSIPMEWVLTFPDSLRRGDVVKVYEIPEEFQEKVGAAAEKTEGMVEHMTAGELELISDDVNHLFDSTLMFVKDSASREVITVSSNERYDSSSKISSLELIVDDEKLGLMKQSREDGNHFIIVY